MTLNILVCAMSSKASIGKNSPAAKLKFICFGDIQHPIYVNMCCRRKDNSYAINFRDVFARNLHLVGSIFLCCTMLCNEIPYLIILSGQDTSYEHLDLDRRGFYGEFRGELCL